MQRGRGASGAKETRENLIPNSAIPEFSPHPTPYTPHPTPHTLHPTPYTPHPIY
ncbi:hypothetical protein [Chroococcidiopsis sp.]|uniref:hypothetical protein n=1 Tax=Chroococcidiopsis sp. TaxID=3088168 RepID=UPI003F40D871